MGYQFQGHSGEEVIMGLGLRVEVQYFMEEKFHGLNFKERRFTHVIVLPSSKNFI